MKIKYPAVKQDQSMYEAFLKSAKTFPNKIALRFFHKTFTYKKVLKRVNQFAKSLLDLGFKKDDVITVCLPNIPDAVYLLYAINQIGAIGNLVHPLFTFEQMDETLTLVNSKILFCLDTNYEKFLPLENKGVTIYSCSPVSELSSLKRFFYNKKNKDKLKIKPKHTSSEFYKSKEYFDYDKRYLNDALYLHSGGTTGKSKTIALSSFAMNSVATNSYWITDLDSFVGKGILAVLPMFHGFGLCMGIHAFLVHGGTDVLMPKFSRAQALSYIRKNQLHILLGVPVLYEALLSRRDFRGRKLRNLYIGFVGGDYVSPALLERFNIRMEKAHSNCRLREGYGLTETVNVCSVNTHSNHKPGTVGILLPNVKGTTLNPDTMEELKANEEGEILIGGDTIMNGYRFSDDIDANKKVFYIAKDGTKYIRTGDFGHIDEDRFVIYKSRIKRLVKVNGVPVFPSMIEDAATSFNFVYEVCALGVEDTKRGNIIKLYVMLSKTYKGTKEEAKEKIIERIVSRLGVYSRPKEVIFVDKMPHTAVGKIDYKALK